MVVDSAALVRRTAQWLAVFVAALAVVAWYGHALNGYVSMPTTEQPLNAYEFLTRMAIHAGGQLLILFGVAWLVMYGAVTERLGGSAIAVGVLLAAALVTTPLGLYAGWLTTWEVVVLLPVLLLPLLADSGGVRPVLLAALTVFGLAMLIAPSPTMIALALLAAVAVLALAERHAQHGHLEPASAIRVTDSAALPRLTAVELQRSARLERARKAVAIAVGAAVVLLAFTVLLAVAQWATPDETESEFRLTEGAIPPHLVASAAGSQATRRERKERERQAQQMHGGQSAMLGTDEHAAPDATTADAKAVEDEGANLGESSEGTIGEQDGARLSQPSPRLREAESALSFQRDLSFGNATGPAATFRGPGDLAFTVEALKRMPTDAIRPSGTAAAGGESASPHDQPNASNTTREAAEAEIWVAMEPYEAHEALERHYWQLDAFAHYVDGRWLRDAPRHDQLRLDSDKDGWIALPAPGAAYSPQPNVLLRIRLRPVQDRLCPLPSPAAAIRAPAMYQSRDGIVRFAADVSRRGVRYDVRPALHALDQVLSEADVARYLAVPDDVVTDERFREWLAGIEMHREPGMNTVDVARLVARSFDTGEYRYELKPDLAATIDPNLGLLQHKRGYCQHYASLMTIGMRALGIPARVAVGFQPGEFDRANNRLLVRPSRAHAWCQVWFDGAGWIDVDPLAEASIGAALVARRAAEQWWQRLGEMDRTGNGNASEQEGELGGEYLPPPDADTSGVPPEDPPSIARRRRGGDDEAVDVPLPLPDQLDQPFGEPGDGSDAAEYDDELVNAPPADPDVLDGDTPDSDDPNADGVTGAGGTTKEDGSGGNGTATGGDGANDAQAAAAVQQAREAEDTGLSTLEWVVLGLVLVVVLASAALVLSLVTRQQEDREVEQAIEAQMTKLFGWDPQHETFEQLLTRLAAVLPLRERVVRAYQVWEAVLAAVEVPRQPSEPAAVFADRMAKQVYAAQQSHRALASWLTLLARFVGRFERACYAPWPLADDDGEAVLRELRELHPDHDVHSTV